jgi:hypothetical protein
MSEPEGFLSRWARRKSGVAENDPSQEPQAEPADGRVEEQLDTAPDQPSAESENEKKAKEDKAPAFDLSTLPSIDSITADTDIRGFLAPGVPPALTQAALRRAWVVDPKIRDFIEMAENQWDFTVTGGAPGFDLSPPTGDIKRMLAQILSEPPLEQAGDDKPASAEPESRQVAALSAPEGAAHREVNEPPPQPNASAIERDKEFASPRDAVTPENSAAESAASQQDTAEQHVPRLPRRGHGGAMPR